MTTTIPKELREHIARANGYMLRDDTKCAIGSICAALRFIDSSNFTQHARAEIHTPISDFLHNLTSHQHMTALLNPENSGILKTILYKPGQEAKLCIVLEGLASLLEKNSPMVLQKEAEERLARKKKLIESALLYSQQGLAAKSNAFFRRIVEEFSDDKGIFLHVARLLVETGQTQLAAEMFEQAVAAQPREHAAYTGAADAWTELQEYEKAEAIYKTMLHIVGGHPATFGKMAKLYLAWDKNSEAEYFASCALQIDPTQQDALEVQEMLGTLDKK